MKRIVPLALACLLLAVGLAGQGAAKDRPQETSRPPKDPEEYRAMLERMIANIKKERENAPTTLTEAHARLEQRLSPETLAEIDAMRSEDEMIKYHFGLGSSIRSGWGLGGDLPLSQSLRELGFLASDDMSGLILETFWCKRHRQDLRLEERAAIAKAYWRARGLGPDVLKARSATRKQMMGLRLVQQDVPTVRIAPRRPGVTVRFMCPFGNGVFLTAYCPGSVLGNRPLREGYYVDPNGQPQPMSHYDGLVYRGYCLDPKDGEVRKMRPGEDFYTQAYYFDPADGQIHKIQVAQVGEVYAAVVAGDRAWLAGLTDGKPVLVRVSDKGRVTVPLPEENEIPDLGLDGQFLLAVYAKTVYRLTDHEWTIVHSGDLLLPRSGLPPQRHGNMLFLRDEGSSQSRKRLWWLTMGESSRLNLLKRDVDRTGFEGAAWHSSSAYCVTSSGDLWVCNIGGTSLLRRSKDGDYAFAIIDRSVESARDRAGARVDRSLFVSAVTALPDDGLLLAGDSGLYRLEGGELVQILAFAPAETADGRVAHHLDFYPTSVLVLDDRSYFIGTGSRNGAYVLHQGDDGQWTCQHVAEGDPVVW